MTRLGAVVPAGLLIGFLGLVVVVALVCFVLFSMECSDLDHEIARLEKEIQAQPAPGSTPQAQQIARAPFATWAHLVAGLHEAAAASDLETFHYETNAAITIDDPRQALATGVRTSQSASDQTPPPGSSTGESYRAMTATARGLGSYEAIVRFVDSLPAVEPALALDQIEIRATPEGPRFEARVHLTTVLPVEAPRVIRLEPDPYEPPSSSARAPRGEAAGHPENATARSWVDPARWPLPDRQAELSGQIPRDLMKAAPVPVPARDLSHLRARVILWSPDRPMALIAGRVVEIGDRIDDHIVEEIRPESVTLVPASGQGSRTSIPLGQTLAPGLETLPAPQAPTGATSTSPLGTSP